MDTRVIYNEVTGKHEIAYPSVGTANPIVKESGAQTLTNKTLTSPTITGATLTATSATLTTPAIVSPAVTGDAGSGVVYSKTVLFTENATSTIHTGTVVVPAGATLLDIYVVPQVLWTATTSAAFTCGDANSANGWFTSTNLKATDLVLGERLQASQAVATDGSYGGTKEGAYVTTAGRFGQQSTNMIGGYCPTAYSVIGVVTVVDPATTAGRTRMTVLWTIGETVAPVLT
jgi:hypothetical protein